MKEKMKQNPDVQEKIKEFEKSEGVTDQSPEDNLHHNAEQMQEEIPRDLQQQGHNDEKELIIKEPTLISFSFTLTKEDPAHDLFEGTISFSLDNIYEGLLLQFEGEHCKPLPYHPLALTKQGPYEIAIQGSLARLQENKAKLFLRFHVEENFLRELEHKLQQASDKRINEDHWQRILKGEALYEIIQTIKERKPGPEPPSSFGLSIQLLNEKDKPITEIHEQEKKHTLVIKTTKPAGIVYFILTEKESGKNILLEPEEKGKRKEEKHLCEYVQEETIWHFTFLPQKSQPAFEEGKKCEIQAVAKEKYAMQVAKGSLIFTIGDDNKTPSKPSDYKLLIQSLITEVGQFRALLESLLHERFISTYLVDYINRLTSIEATLDNEIDKINELEHLGSFSSFKKLLAIIESFEEDLKNHIPAAEGDHDPKVAYMHNVQQTIAKTKRLKNIIYEDLKKLEQEYKANKDLENISYIKAIMDNFEQLERGLNLIADTLETFNTTILGIKRKVYHKNKNSFLSLVYQLINHDRPNDMTLQQELTYLHELIEKQEPVVKKEEEVKKILILIKTQIIEKLKDNFIITQKQLHTIKERYLPLINRYLAWLQEQ